MPTPSGGKTQTQHNTAKKWPLSELCGSGSRNRKRREERENTFKREHKAGN